MIYTIVQKNRHLVAFREIQKGFKFRLIPTKISAILAFYPPLWIVAHLFFSNTQSQQTPLLSSTIIPNEITPPSTDSPPTLQLPHWTSYYSFWFALLFAAAHSTIVFFTQDRLVSLGRYIFGQPFIFLAMGYLCTELDRKQLQFLFPWGWGISSMFLLNHWIRYGNHQWLG